MVLNVSFYQTPQDCGQKVCIRDVMISWLQRYGLQYVPLLEHYWFKQIPLQMLNTYIPLQRLSWFKRLLLQTKMLYTVCIKISSETLLVKENTVTDKDAVYSMYLFWDAHDCIEYSYRQRCCIQYVPLLGLSWLKRIPLQAKML